MIFKITLLACDISAIVLLYTLTYLLSLVISQRFLIFLRVRSTSLRSGGGSGTCDGIEARALSLSDFS